MEIHRTLERFLTGNVVLMDPKSLDILDLDSFGFDFELPTAPTVSDAKKRVSTGLFRKQMESVLSDAERCFIVISGSSEYLNTTKKLREKLQGKSLALVPDLAVWYLIWEAFCEFFRIVKSQKESAHAPSMSGPENVAKIFQGVIDDIQWTWDESKWQFVLSPGALGGVSFGAGKKRSFQDGSHVDVGGGGSSKAGESSSTATAGGSSSSPPRQQRKLADKVKVEAFCGYHLANFLGCKKDGVLVQCHHQTSCKKGPHTDFKVELTKNQVLRVLEDNKEMYIGPDGKKNRKGTEGFYLGEKLYNDVVSAVTSAKNKFK